MGGGPVTIPSTPPKLTCTTAVCRCQDAANNGLAGPAIQMCSALITDPQTPDMERGDAYLARALAYEDFQIYSSAIADSTEALSINIKRNDLQGVGAAYTRRGDNYFQNKEDDKAISDFSAAIAADPENPRRYTSRAGTYSLMGKTDLALADFEAAIQHTGRRHIDIGHGIVMNITYTGADAYLGRGYLDFLNGQYIQAASDISYALKLEPQSPEAILWIHYAKLHQGIDDKAEFDANAAAASPTAWPDVLLALFLGKATPEDVHRVQTPADHQIGLDRVCDGSFAIAEWEHFVNHDDGAARRTYKIVTDSCPRSMDSSISKIMLQKIP